MNIFFSHINKKTTYTDPRLAFAEDESSRREIKQKFDGNSTALQILSGRDLSGKYVIVTGGNSGIGNHCNHSSKLWMTLTMMKINV